MHHRIGLAAWAMLLAAAPANAQAPFHLQEATIASIHAAFASGQLTCAQLVKLYSSPDITGPNWFSAISRVTGTIPSVRCGRPEPRFVSTSHVERLNLSVRMHLRRYVRRTNAHSRKLTNHKASVTLWIAWYNFCRVNSAMRVTPAMESGLADHVWTMKEMLLF